MTKPPFILISPNVEKKGDEFGDLSISLSETYQQALMSCGAIPMALGGTLVADILGQMPRAMNHRRMDRRSEIVHDVRLTPGSLLAKITGRQRLGVNSTHHQAVGRVAAPLKVAAVSSDGIVESLELRPGAANRLPFLLSVQFHPERLADRYPEHRAIFRGFTQACALGRKE